MILVLSLIHHDTGMTSLMVDTNITQVEHVIYRTIGEQTPIYGRIGSDYTPNTSFRFRDKKKKIKMLNSMISHAGELCSV